MHYQGLLYARQGSSRYNKAEQALVLSFLFLFGLQTLPACLPASQPTVRNAKAPMLIGPYIAIADGLILECESPAATTSFSLILIDVIIPGCVSSPEEEVAWCLLSLLPCCSSSLRLTDVPTGLWM